ncbi:ATP-dependent DNA ligase [Actinospica sp. MGRD01-02]|uniref:ATP-dependent DNA ligase n=1 Tax=Actinospica acidithermotolerans TaxID=2828514 RepID=A0A941EC16_9ACTN|nr:ATP-dependent DNA ligase [Actinospica acidithermotolerans]MBR7828766.1 ATP-dependent DNA ligase [Actinospica acidithermotolerans]
MQVPESMLTAPTNTAVLPARMIAEPKWDGIRAWIARFADGRVLVRSRRGTDLTAAFPELEAAAAALPATCGEILLDGEIVLWFGGKLAFDKLLSRMGRKRASAVRLAAELPVNFVAFDLVHLDADDLRAQPYARRRAKLVELFARLELAPPWTLCPASADPDEIASWLAAWLPLGIEGLCFKRADQPYQPGRRGWLKYRVRHSTEAVVGAVTGRIEAPSSLLLGRFDESGRLRYVARTTTIARTSAAEVGALLTPAAPAHPWAGRRPSPRWNAADPDQITLVEPQVVAEFSGDLAQDARGVFRHLVRLLRIRPDLCAADAPRASAGGEAAAG